MTSTCIPFHRLEKCTRFPSTLDPKSSDDAAVMTIQMPALASQICSQPFQAESYHGTSACFLTLPNSAPAAEAWVMQAQVSFALISGLKSSTTRAVWCTSSRVGAMMRAYGFWPAACLAMPAKMGSTNARVLPLPVGEIASTSRFLRKRGRTWLCIAVGHLSFSATRLWRMDFCRRSAPLSSPNACRSRTEVCDPHYKSLVNGGNHDPLITRDHCLPAQVLGYCCLVL